MVLWRKCQADFRAVWLTPLDAQRSPQPRGAFAHDGQPVVTFWFIQAGNTAAIVSDADPVVPLGRDLTANHDLPCIGMFDGVEHRFTHNLQRMYLLLSVKRLGRKPTV